MIASLPINKRNERRNQMKKIFVCVLALLTIISVLPVQAADLTLRSLGAVGDGKTDDRSAIEAALNGAKGAPVDGEGLTYAVWGNIEVTTGIDFRNATLVQTMEPPKTASYIPSVRGGGTLTVDPPDAFRKTVKELPYLRADGVGTYDVDPVLGPEDLAAVMPGIALRTLSIRGSDDNHVPVRLENIKIDRGRHPSSGGRSDSFGLSIERASPVEAIDIEITGDGKGKGLSIHKCNNVRLARLNIHDMNWAPYEGDNIFEILTAESVRDDFGWNNFPIYEYRASMKRFVRVRIQEQLVGLWVSNTEDVKVIDSKIDRLQAAIGGELYPLQADGMTVNRVKNSVVRDSHFSKTINE